jgi:hypothetical protein
MAWSVAVEETVIGPVYLGDKIVGVVPSTV